MPELILLRQLLMLIRSRWDELRVEPEAGYTTEFVVVTVAVVVMALAVLAIIATKVIGGANNIQLTNGGS